MTELRPVLVVTLMLDGDDYPPTAVEVARVSLEAALQGMVAAGEIRGYELGVAA